MCHGGTRTLGRVIYQQGDLKDNTGGGRKDNEGVITITRIGGHEGLDPSGGTRPGKEGHFGKMLEGRGWRGRLCARRRAEGVVVTQSLERMLLRRSRHLSNLDSLSSCSWGLGWGCHPEVSRGQAVRRLGETDCGGGACGSGPDICSSLKMEHLDTCLLVRSG